MKTIFRVQNGEGYGPYGANISRTGVTSSDWARSTELMHNNHPTPRDDGIDPFPFGWRCAFSGAKDLLDWFTDGELTSLESLGFDIWELDVSESHEDGTPAKYYGHKQMVFDPYEINHQELWDGKLL